MPFVVSLPQLISWLSTDWRKFAIVLEAFRRRVTWLECDYWVHLGTLFLPFLPLASQSFAASRARSWWKLASRVSSSVDEAFCILNGRRLIVAGDSHRWAGSVHRSRSCTFGENRIVVFYVNSAQNNAAFAWYGRTELHQVTFERAPNLPLYPQMGELNKRR